MIEDNVITQKKYYAAANGFCGFLSYFDHIFNVWDYNKIYVLKGGPGTGKSTLMRRLENNFASDGHSIEEIYCSSDKSSLDGVIIKKGNNKVAIIDGTSPHERDAKIPGVFDEIVNLGDNLDKRWLDASRDTILSLIKEKKDAYATSYRYLKIAGCAFDLIKGEALESAKPLKMKKTAEKILQNAKIKKKGSESIRLISSFGKEGYQSLPTIKNITTEGFIIGGDPLYSSILLEEIRKTCNDRGLKFQSSPSPLCQSLCEAIYFEERGYGIYYDETNADLVSDELFQGESSLRSEKTRKARQLLFDALDEASRWFSVASDLHSRLERLYSNAVDFERNDRMAKELAKDMAAQLNKIN